MTVKTVLKLGAPSLLEPSLAVLDFNNPKWSELEQDLIDTRTYWDGAGISAPQIGVNYRVFIMGFSVCKRYPKQKPFPHRLFINPGFKPLSTRKNLAWEGCLSVPGLKGVVECYDAIRYWAYDLKGQRIEGEVSGFEARAFQHELNHLDGVLFVHCLYDKRLLAFEDVLDESLLDTYR